MPLIPPALDDRSYSDLVQDMLASIPAHTPEWTIQQEGDPGRTLIELFAWLADSILYRANLIPERQRLAFLKLLGLPLEPAGAANGILSIVSDPAATTAVTIASGASVAGPVNFETLTEVDVLPVTAQAYIKAPLTSDQLTAAQPLLAGLMSLYNLSTVPSGYTTTPVFANNLADPNGIDVFGGTIDQCLWIALLAPKPANLAAIRATLNGGNGQRVLSIGMVPALNPADPFGDIGPRAAVPVTYQISGNPTPGQPLVYYPLTVVPPDPTNGLTTAGVVQLILPQGAGIGAPPNDVRSDAQAGVGPKPPRIDDPDIDSMLVTWIRINVQSAVTLTWAGINAVSIDQRTTYNNVIAGVSDGTPNQQFALAQKQIDPDTFQLDVDMPGLSFQTWNPVDDLAVVQGPLPAYVLDPEAGTVTFGNQMQGMIPPVNRVIRATLMRAGGGAAGNLPASTLKAVQGVDVTGKSVSFTAQQPVATTGGSDAETLDHAEQRIPATLRHQERAVTAQDYKDLVGEMPGGGVARVEVLPLFKPQTRDTNVAGVVSVMAVPPKYDYQPPCPRADRTLLESVYAWLNPKRPIAAEMYVIGTEYVGLGLSVAVEVGSGFDLLQVQQQVQQALRMYLWPLAPGGAAGQGWPLGRTVRSLELEVIVSRVTGVTEVNGVLLFQALTGGAYQQIQPDSGGNAELTLESWQLPEALQVSVTAGPDGSGVAPPSLTPDTQTDNNMAVPVVPAVC